MELDSEPLSVVTDKKESAETQLPERECLAGMLD